MSWTVLMEAIIIMQVQEGLVHWKSVVKEDVLTILQHCQVNDKSSMNIYIYKVYKNNQEYRQTIKIQRSLTMNLNNKKTNKEKPIKNLHTKWVWLHIESRSQFANIRHFINEAIKLILLVHFINTLKFLVSWFLT